MRHAFPFVLATIMLTSTINANPVDPSTARRVADTWMHAMGMRNTTTLVNITDQTPFTEFYVFAAPNGGFILVSADDCAIPVLGYSVENHFDAETIPSNVLSILNGYENEIRHGKLLYRKSSNVTLWKRLANGDVPPTPFATAVTPLLTTSWGQAPYYNEMCPYDSNETVTGNNRIVTGCVNTATAQIMKYYNYPISGYGSNIYSWQNYENLSADFGNTIYDWNNMPDSLTANSDSTEVAAIATLMYHIGVANETMYDLAMYGGSGAYNYYPTFEGNLEACSQNSLMTYFKYRPDMANIIREAYSDSEYCAILRAELEQNRPILYSGYGSGGHSFVCDGYSNDGLFHFNWGWRGRFDGYFAIGHLVPNDLQFSNKNGAIIGIRPNEYWNTEGTTTLTANVIGGTAQIHGAGTYSFGDTIALTVDNIAEGYRFKHWSDGDCNNPRMIFASGGDYNFTAQLEPIKKDTISYCGDRIANVFATDLEDYDYRWGIRIPKSLLTANTALDAVQIYIYEPGTFTLNVYTGTTEPSEIVYTDSITFGNNSSHQWQTMPINAPLTIDTSKNIWIIFSNTDTEFPAAMTYYSGNEDSKLIGNDLRTCDDYFTFLIRGIFKEIDTSDATKLTNLVIFVRFSDDEEIDHSFEDIDKMFNSKQPGFLSVYNFYDAMTYGKIHYKTVYTNNIHNGVIVSYVDPMPRAYFEPYSENNPIGYFPEEQPFEGVSMREAQLLGRIVHYVDSMHLVNSNVVLDGDGDGDIDNISFITKGSTGEWASILWPHMEYFPHDSLGYISTINGIMPNAYNFEFEGAQEQLFCTDVFRHEMGHSLNMPDLYHYINYANIAPADLWDMMHYAYQTNHTNAMFKYKYLHVVDPPIEITTDGDYTINSLGSSPSQNCYYIKSAIDSTQWFTFEYRNQNDLFEDGIPGTGLIAARWNDTVPIINDIFSNAYFDFYTIAHQYWIFRPGSDIDTVNGDVFNAHFSFATGRTSFGPNTDPHPYLTDGTPETSFEITNIHENGTELTFHVHFLNTQGIENGEQGTENDNLKIFVANRQIVVEGAGHNTVEVFDILGRHVNNKSLQTGVYIVRIGNTTRKVVVM